MTTLIEAKNLTRYYSDYCAVNDVSFDLSSGEILGFLGPNGAGKTTTMQMLSGNLAPSAGQINIHGFDILEQPKQAKRWLGYLPDTPPLYKELTVDEFLNYCGRLHQLSFRTINTAINHAKERCGLTDVSDRLIVNLSKGYQQRVGVAQAILHNPEIIILDEPTVGLDPIQIKEIRALIKELGSDHGIILSTHILSEVQESCTHVQIINQGQLILKETIADLDQRMSTASIKVVCRSPIAEEKFTDLNNITQIEKLTESSYLIHYDSQKNSPIEAIAEMIINNAYGLEALTPMKKSMEDIFITLTSNIDKTTSTEPNK